MQDLDIVNRALTFLGSHPAETMSDIEKNSARAISAYSKCRDEVLRMVPWTCCLKRALLKDCGKQATPWVARHTYGAGERVTNDTLKTYTCTTSGKSASAGGPTGSGTAIADGTCVWNYVELSTALTNWCHRVLTPYEVGDIASWDMGKVYICTEAGTSAAANQPEGTSEDILDGTCRWKYYATIPANLTVYTYQYIIPPDCLRALKVPLPTAIKESEQGAQYSIEGKFLYTDLVDATLRYVYDTPVDEWDVLLQATVAARIAAEIAFDVTGQKDMLGLAQKMVGGLYADARQVAMGEAQEGVEEKIRWEEV